MTGRRFNTPDWGQDHLSLDAVVAYVDDELSAGAHQRADTHLACCRDCRAEVVAQRQARAALRAAGGPRLPSSLMHTLRAIPVEAELPPPPPGLGITADGQFVLLRDAPVPDERCPGQLRGPAARADGARRPSRRVRLGAVSGLALGALTVGVLAVPDTATPPGQGVLGGAVLDGAARSAAPAVLSTDAVDARLPAAGGPTGSDPASSASPSAEPTPSGDTPSDDSGVLDPAVRQRLDRAPVAYYNSP